MVHLRRLVLFFALASLIACASPKEENSQLEAPLSEVPNDELWTIERAKALQDEVVFIDVRKEKDFVLAHIPGAKQVWRNDIQSKKYPYGGMAADRETIRALFSNLGVDSSSQVLLYDAKGGCDAARLWWLLKSYGHEKAALLNGGIQAWEMAGNALEEGPAGENAPSAFAFTQEENLGMWISLEELLDEIKSGNVLLLDTRSSEEFNGEKQKDGASLAGTIPGSVHYDWGNAVQMSSSWLLKSEADLRHDLEALGVTPDKNIVTFCHTGVRSAHTTFVLRELLHYPNVRNYDGSWTEWSYLLKHDSLGVPLRVGLSVASPRP